MSESIDLFWIEKKSPKTHPGLSNWKNTQQKEQEELKKSLQVREKIRAEYIRTIREALQVENFAGKTTIQVTPEKTDPTVIYIWSKDAKLQIDLHYDESYESTDSLRKNIPIYPTTVSLTWNIEGELYTLEELSIEESAKIWGEILKHIERKKNPKDFGYIDIKYSVNRLQDTEWNPVEEIILVGKRANGKMERIPFFESLDIENREMIYWYLAHSLWSKLPDKFFQKNIQPSTTTHRDAIKDI